VAAALQGQVTQVRQLIEADPALLAARTMFGVGAVHAAHFGGQDAVLAELDRLGLVIGGFLAAELGDLRQLHGTLAARPEFAVSFGERGALHIPPLASAVATTPGIPQPSDDEDAVLDLVRLLLERGADVNGRRADGMTALHSACWRGLARVAQELLDAGADPAITATGGPHQGQAPADTALAQGHLLLAARLDIPGQALSGRYG
jgi:uncharacterized protein